MSEFVGLSGEEDFEIVHKERKRFLTVTNFITFIGWGYNSRRDLFRDKPIPTYALEAMKHGKKYEPVCLELFKEYFSKEYDCFEFNNTLSIYNSEYRLLGTADAYAIHRLTLEKCIIEIKCPYGAHHGRTYETPNIKWYTDKKNHKHWFQLQLYLFLHKDFGFDYGILIYYYHHGGPNGEKMLIVSKVKRHEGIEDMLQIKDWMNLLDKFDMKKIYRSQRIDGDLSQIILKGLVSLQSILI